MRVEIADNGRIGAVGALEREPTRRLRGRALIPGMISAHSHAFQRGLRGRGERFPAGAGSFWTWREAMYALVDQLDAAELHRWSVQAFREMLAAGITTVGEFHYVHHPAGRGDFALDRVVLDAAAEAGIRIVLLNAYYRTGGVGRPLVAAQRRFDAISPERYWEHMDHLAVTLDAPGRHLGAVVHSVRAAPPEEIAAVYREARQRGLVFHIHLEEQRREIDDCVAAYGRRPMALLCDALGHAEGVTAVHCTHTEPADMERYLKAGGRVCVCPLTEANLGDGLPNLATVHAAGGRLSLGTDSNARISMVEEMRWMEYGQRLRRERRGPLASPDGGAARTVFDAATVGGAEALGIAAGRIAPGAWADFAAIDLTAPALAGADDATLLDAFVFGAGDAAVSAVCVGGRWRDVTAGSR